MRQLWPTLGLMAFLGAGVQLSVSPSSAQQKPVEPAQLAQSIESQAEAAAAQLVHDPHDPAANGVAGGYLCFVKGDWSLGLPMLARCEDLEIAQAAQTELAQPGAIDDRLTLADHWAGIAADFAAPFRRGIVLHADEIYRRAYPEAPGLERWKLDRKLLSQALLIFDSDNPPPEHWVEERLRFWGNHGREGRGSWANYGAVNERHVIDVVKAPRMLVANRAGYVETLESFPPKGVDRYEIEAELWSDLLPGTAFEFGGQRMYFGGEHGIELESGWRPPIVQPITSGRYYRFVITVAPESISFSVDGRYLGTMKTTELARGPIVLRGWEGHVRCRRLAVWALLEVEETVTMDTAEIEELYEGFASDLKALRKREPVRFPDGTVAGGSSGEAVAAAQRVFAHFPNIGYSRAHVLEVLGDPATISVYGVEAGDGPDDPLVYRFDTGYNGVQFTIRFASDAVAGIEERSIE